MKYLKEFWYYWKKLWINPWWYVMIVPILLSGNNIYGVIKGTLVAMIIIPLFVMIVARIGQKHLN